jgi:hypothetical protein
VVTGVWDNSAANRDNPDPKAEVKWGDQSWEEMLLAMVTLSIDPDTGATMVLRACSASAGVRSGGERPRAGVAVLDAKAAIPPGNRSKGRQQPPMGQP